LLRPLGLVARRQRKWGQNPGLLEFLLSDFIGAPGRPLYIASDPRDIIFGLLSIASDAEYLGLQPNYIQTTVEVYAAATRAIVERCPHYSLDYSAFPKDIDDLPTWVPNWQRVGRLGISYTHPVSYRNLFNGSAGRAQTPSSGLLPTPLQGIPAWRILQQRRFSVDVVTAAFASDQHGVGTKGEPAPTLARALASQDEQRTRILQAILVFVFAAHPYLDATELETVLWRTLTANYPIADKYNTLYDILAVRIFRQQPIPINTLTKEDVSFILRSTPPYPRRPDPAAATQAQVDKYSELLLHRASSTYRGRTLFATAGGRLGLGPEKIQTGDVVTILLGTAVPIVLRPATAGCFTFVGGAYVHGIMNGEFMDRNPREEDFDIV
jgi:hypothetical protein